MIEVSFCTEQQLVETVTLFREHPVHVSQSYYCTARILANSLHAEQGRGQLSIGRQGLREPLVRSTVDLRNLES